MHPGGQSLRCCEVEPLASRPLILPIHCGHCNCVVPQRLQPGHMCMGCCVGDKDAVGVEGPLCPPMCELIADEVAVHCVQWHGVPLYEHCGVIEVAVLVWRGRGKTH